MLTSQRQYVTKQQHLKAKLKLDSRKSDPLGSNPIVPSSILDSTHFASVDNQIKIKQSNDKSDHLPEVDKSSDFDQNTVVVRFPKNGLGTSLQHFSSLAASN
mmetsp:Transcript_15052/g.23288  ORF Transcript_15052/g.23288 Transcript_15052/m.23288 type:complete len:102 (-) Transcript_15052:8153-8458(-)